MIKSQAIIIILQLEVTQFFKSHSELYYRVIEYYM